MTISEYLQSYGISIKQASQILGVDSSNFSKAIRGRIPISVKLYKKIKTSFLKDCTLSNLVLSAELQKKITIIDKQVAEELEKKEKDGSLEINKLDLNLRITNKEPHKIINIDRDLAQEIKDKTEAMKKLVEENKKMFKINFKYAKQYQNALDCLDDLEIQLQLLRSIISKDKNLQEFK